MTRVSLRGRYIRHSVRKRQVKRYFKFVRYGIAVSIYIFSIEIFKKVVNSSLDFTNVINPRRCCVNLQAIWHIISTWPNNRSRGLKLLSILPKFCPLLAVPVRMYVSSHAGTLQR
jgi:hypothetical protein